MTRLMRRFARGRLPALLAGVFALAFASAHAAPAKKIASYDGIFAPGFAAHAVTPNGMLALTASRVPSIGGDDFTLHDVLVDSPLMEDVNLNAGYRVDSMAGLFNIADANASFAYDDLFVLSAAVNSPYVSLTDGGSFLGTTLRLANDLHFTLAQSTLTPSREQFWLSPFAISGELTGSAPDRRNVEATVAGLNWNATDWARFGVTASQTTERNSLLGRSDTEALALADSAKTTAVGISGRVGLGGGWITTASYSEGITQLDLKPSTIMATASDLRSRAYGISVAKHGLFGHNDSLGLALSRPVQIYSGSATLVTMAGLDSRASSLNYTQENLSLATRTPETDVELGYVTTFFDGALALQTNAAYQMNLAGRNGKNALAVVSRAKINF